jgi:hypothetical protein
MIEAGTMNDNEIIVRKGLAKGDLVLLARPADQNGIDTEKIPGLKPVSSGDSVKAVPPPEKPTSVTLPVKPKS